MSVSSGVRGRSAWTRALRPASGDTGYRHGRRATGWQFAAGSSIPLCVRPDAADGRRPSVHLSRRSRAGQQGRPPPPLLTGTSRQALRAEATNSMRRIAHAPPVPPAPRCAAVHAQRTRKHARMAHHPAGLPNVPVWCRMVAVCRGVRGASRHTGAAAVGLARPGGPLAWPGSVAGTGGPVGSAGYSHPASSPAGARAVLCGLDGVRPPRVGGSRLEAGGPVGAPAAVGRAGRRLGAGPQVDGTRLCVGSRAPLCSGHSPRPMVCRAGEDLESGLRHGRGGRRHRPVRRRECGRRHCVGITGHRPAPPARDRARAGDTRGSLRSGAPLGRVAPQPSLAGRGRGRGSVAALGASLGPGGHTRRSGPRRLLARRHAGPPHARDRARPGRGHCPHCGAGARERTVVLPR